ncbi:uncharacterized protein TNCV_486851 [Trichonephila clavipes]|nr:uncharacterized protein TNCV_486851 [Trichonephila clavipes]
MEKRFGYCLIVEVQYSTCPIGKSRQDPSPSWRFSLELNTRIRSLGLPPENQWYQCSHPGVSLAHGLTRQNQTLLARFRSGHIKSMKFSEGRKSFEMCTNCSSEPATPAHILECLGLTKKDLADDPLLVLDFLKVYDVMDLVNRRIMSSSLVPMKKRRVEGLPLSGLKRPPIGVVWKLGDEMPAQVWSLSLDHGSKLRSPSLKAVV